MAILTNRELIATPDPGPRRYGLFDVATVTDDLSAAAIRAGVQHRALDCGDPLNEYDANCTTHPPKVASEGQPYIGGDPYWRYALEQCGTVGTTAAEASERARRVLLGGEQTSVEAAVWASLVADAGAVTVVPAAGGAGAALAALEASFYAVYGYVGTIHLNTAGYAALSYAEVLDDAPDGRLVTPLRSQYAIGAGYDVTGPGGAAPDAGSVWAFMTPQVFVQRQAQIITPDPVQTMDRTGNQWRALAERIYLHRWSCPVVHAVQIPVASPAAVMLEAPAPPAGLVTENVEETV